MNNLGRTIAICGVAQTAVGRVEGPDSMQLHAEAAKLAIDDAGLSKDDIDGVLTTGAGMFNSVLAEYLGIYPRYSSIIQTGGATAVSSVIHAATAIAMGVCNTVLCVFGRKALSGGRSNYVEQLAAIGHPEFESPYGPLIPGLYALAAQRYMYEFGVTSEQLAEVAVAMRKHAMLTPGAQMNGEITIEDVVSSRLIADPLHLLDCCIVSDGAGAVIVTSAERAKDLRWKPVYVLGLGEGHTHEYISQAPSLLHAAGCREAGLTAFGMADIKPSDIDAALLYDCFTPVVLIELEDYGFCAKGEGGAFVENGRIQLGGQLPVNPHGGLLSYAHIGGILHIVEGVRQIRGQCGDRQVERCNNVLVSGNGGVMSTHSCIILGS